MRQGSFKHELVASLPEKLEGGFLYITHARDVAGHLCACGCRREVITPLSPTDWKLSIEGGAPTLKPSIGNWAFPCRSHYYIRGGEVLWAGSMSTKAIVQGRQRDRARKQAFYSSLSEPLPLDPVHMPEVQLPKQRGFVERLASLWRSIFAV